MRHLTATFLLAIGFAGSAAAQEPEPEFTRDFPLEWCRFVPWGGNDFFCLGPGAPHHFSNATWVEAGECDAAEDVWITVLPEVRKISLTMGGKRRTIHARVVEEFETEDGELKEISRNFFANCVASRDVYYFGEDVVDGDGNPLLDSWLAGRNGAAPGIIMPDQAFLLGARYYQEVAPGLALIGGEAPGEDD